MGLKRILIGLAFSGWLIAAGAALTIPKDATANEDGTYSWTDKQGHKWVYVQTPFGVSRTDESLRPKSKALPKGVPAGAKPNSNGTYSYTDKAGAKWTYTITPFGPSKMPAADSEIQPQQQELIGLVKVIDKGDTVRFERTTPFGQSVYEKKKTELTDDERRLLEKQTLDTQPVPRAN